MPDEEEIRQRILREKEAEVEKLAKEHELEEENAKLEKEIEQEIQGKLAICIQMTLVLIFRQSSLRKNALASSLPRSS